MEAKFQTFKHPIKLSRETGKMSQWMFNFNLGSHL